MLIHYSDASVVGETDSTLFSTTQSGPTQITVIIKNVGSNVMNYHFQAYSGTSWNDMDQPGTPLNNSLDLDQVVSQVVSSIYSQVRLLGSASGGTTLEFDVTRYASRASGGPIPLLNL